MKVAKFTTRTLMLEMSFKRVVKKALGVKLNFRIRSLFFLTFIVSVGIVAAPYVSKIWTWRISVSELTEFRQSNYLKFGYADVNSKTRPIFETTIDQLIEVGPFATTDEKIEVFESCVSRLNHLNQELWMIPGHGVIETVERELYCDVISILGQKVGIDINPQLEDWRDW